jgi:hypothetical protein
MDLQWSARATPPVFMLPTNQGITDEVGGGNTNLSTLRYNNNTYTISAVQIIKASHTPWILPITNQASNTEDIVMTFRTTSDTTTYKYIVFVIPVLRVGAAKPSYLEGLANPTGNGAYSLQSCMPSNTHSLFAYYATCLKGTADFTSTQNMYVFVSTEGIQVAPGTMAAIQAKLGGTASAFMSWSPPFINRLTTNTTVINTLDKFTGSVLTTNQLLNFNDFKAMYPNIDQNVREDSTAAYQCVPLDPDTTIADGKLQVDLSTGNPVTLESVLAEREATRNASSVKSSMDSGRLSKYLGTALGAILASILFATIIYFIIAWFAGGTAAPVPAAVIGTAAAPAAYAAAAAAATPPSPFAAILQSLPLYGILILIAGFIGFIIGAMLS